MTDTKIYTYTLATLREKRKYILAATHQFDASNVRVIGDIVEHPDQLTDEIHFLMTFDKTSTIFRQITLWLTLETLLGCDVKIWADHPEEDYNALGVSDIKPNKTYWTKL